MQSNKQCLKYCKLFAQYIILSFTYFIMGDIMNLERFNWFNIMNVVPGWEISVKVLTKFCSDI